MTTKNRSYLLTSLSVLAILACSACSDNSNPKEVMVPFGTLPVAVQKTFVSAMPTQDLTAVELETNNGMAVYEAKSVSASGSKKIVKVDTNGNLVLTKNHSAEIEVSWKKVPKAVRKTILKNNNGMKPDEVEKEKENGVTVYEAIACDSEGNKHFIKVAKNGKLLYVKP